MHQNPSNTARTTLLVPPANLDYHSLVHNSEGACFVWARARRRRSEMLDADFARANARLTKEELEADSAISRAKQWAIRKLLINYL